MREREKKEETQKYLPYLPLLISLPKHILYDATLLQICNHSSSHAIFFQNFCLLSLCLAMGIQQSFEWVYDD